MNYDEGGKEIDYLKATNEILESEGVHQSIDFTILENFKTVFKRTRE